ncbi:MAG: hypothetical protein LBQ54_07295 [Planctomycetaceae bacterium]|nr:hypothetical protein [Planctomycetaceae bacterium]
MANVTRQTRRFFLPMLTGVVLLWNMPLSEAEWNQENLNQRSSVLWDGGTLQKTLTDFARLYKIGIYLDRRVDPDQPVKLQLNDRPIHEILTKLAESFGLGYCQIGSISYIGPIEDARLLPLLFTMRSELVGKLPESAQKKLTQSQRFRSAFLETPQQIFRKIAQTAGCDGKAFGQMPHDLWPELDFPNATPVELLTVLLIGFDSTFVISSDGRTLTPRKIPHDLIISRGYPISENEAKIWQEKIPEMEFFLNSKENRVTVKGRLDNIAKVDSFYRTALAALNAQNFESNRIPSAVTDTSPIGKSKLQPLDSKRFTTKITNKPVRLILQSYAQNMGLRLEIDEDSFRQKGKTLDELVSLELNNATAEEAFRKCLSPVGGTFQMTPGLVRVRAK